MTLTTGIVATSSKPHEGRLPIHPRHLERIPEALRSHLHFEIGYGARFGVADAALAKLGFGLRPRAELLAESELVILPKPQPEDLRALREGALLWGWPHCVQQTEITQAAIDRRLTLLAFEAMFHWNRKGAKGMHLLARNNELAGYCSVLHAFELFGIDGTYGPERRAAVLGFGSVGRGAIHALRGRGIDRITVYTGRPPHRVRDRLPGCRHQQFRRRKGSAVAVEDGRERPMADALADYDLIVNATLQDPEHPLMFLVGDEASRLRQGTRILDVSCDEGMGFPFARPTGFDAPAFPVEGADDVVYYGVDHSPTYLWDAATWEISEALLPYLAKVVEGPDAWAGEPTLSKAVEIRGGVIENPAILAFQGRGEEYPHRIAR